MNGDFLIEFETNVQKIIKRTYNVKSFRFKVPENFTYKAGQFFFVRIKINGEEKQKHFSFSSSPTEKGYVEFTKKLTGHEFSNGLDKLKEGDWARLKGPLGEFTYNEKNRKLAMLTGGIGITPVRGICRFCTDEYPDTNIILLYGNRTEEDIVFKDDFEIMQKENKNLKVIHTLSEPSENWSGYTGHINKEILLKEVPDYLERNFYSCGPPGLVEAMKKILTALAIPKDQIITENFPGY